MAPATESGVSASARIDDGQHYTFGTANGSTDARYIAWLDRLADNYVYVGPDDLDPEPEPATGAEPEVGRFVFYAYADDLRVRRDSMARTKAEKFRPQYRTRDRRWINGHGHYSGQPLPLYGLYHNRLRPILPTLVGEGEKDCDNAWAGVRWHLRGGGLHVRQGIAWPKRSDWSAGRWIAM